MSLACSLLLSLSVCMCVCVCVCVARRRAYKSIFEGEIAESPPGQTQGLQMQSLFINQQTVSPYTGTMEPIPLDKFKDHVERMHSNDDYLFSEEYNVCILSSISHLNSTISLFSLSLSLSLSLAFTHSVYRVLSQTMLRHPLLATCPATFQRTDMPT